MRRILALPLVITGVGSVDLHGALRGEPPSAALPLIRDAVAGASVRGGGGRAPGFDLPKAADA